MIHRYTNKLISLICLKKKALFEFLAVCSQQRFCRTDGGFIDFYKRLLYRNLKKDLLTLAWFIYLVSLQLMTIGSDLHIFFTVFGEVKSSAAYNSSHPWILCCHDFSLRSTSLLPSTLVII